MVILMAAEQGWLWMRMIGQVVLGLRMKEAQAGPCW